MTDWAKIKNEIPTMVYNQRKQLEERIILENWGMEKFDEFHKCLTPMQSAIFFFLELGFTHEWIREHFEYTDNERATWSYHIRNIRRKLKKFLEEQDDI